MRQVYEKRHTVKIRSNSKVSLALPKDSKQVVYKLSMESAQLTLEQHGFELHGSPFFQSMRIFFSIYTYNAVDVFSLSYDFLNIFCSLAYFTV